MSARKASTRPGRLTDRPKRGDEDAPWVPGRDNGGGGGGDHQIVSGVLRWTHLRRRPGWF